MMQSTQLTPLKGLILASIVLLSGCGYSIMGGNPPLPKGAASLGLFPVQNHTFVPDLETSLKTRLKKIIRENSSVRLLPPAQAELRLRITLKEMKNSSSGLDLLQEAGGVTFALKGEVELEERTTGEALWLEENLGVELTESRGSTMDYSNQDPTSSSLNELMALFAQKVYERIFVEF